MTTNNEAPLVVVDEALLAKLGKLARLEIDATNALVTLANIRVMIEAFAVLREFDGEAMVECDHPVVHHAMPERADEVEAETALLGATAAVSDGREAVLANAPAVFEHYFAVPKVVE